jgi:hypothetical protein
MSDSLRILTYNTQLRSWAMEVGADGWIIPSKTAEERAKLIAQNVLTSVHDYDIVCFNEVFDEDARDVFISELLIRYPYAVTKADVSGVEVAWPGKPILPLELATALRTLIAETGLTQDQVARHLGKHKAWVSGVLRILDLPEEVRQKAGYAQRPLSVDALTRIARLDDPNLQTQLVDEVLAGCSQTEIREHIRQAGRGKKSRGASKTLRCKAEVTVSSLMEMPGVVGVGLGWKQRAGHVLSQRAYRVYVRVKRPLSELASEERIPPEINGTQTDVHVMDEWANGGEQNAFLTPGCQITRYIPGQKIGSGTLTLLVEKDGRRYTLSCDHVLLAGQQLQADALDVYSPRHTSCDCRSPIASIQRVAVPGMDDGDPVAGMRLDDLFEIGGKKFMVDAALALITANPARGTNLMTLPGGATVSLDQGLGDLSALASTLEPNPDTEAHDPMRVVTAPPTVHKLGARTGYTTGRVVQLSSTRTFAAPGHPPEVVDVWELTVVPSPGTPWTQDYQLADPSVIDELLPRWAGKPVSAAKLANGWIRLTGPVFALAGDSGSPVWDENRKLVGILTKTAGVKAKVILDGIPVEMTLPNGISQLQYSHAAFQVLGLSPASILAPGVPLRGNRVDEVPRPRPLVDLRDAGVARRAAQETEGGRRLLELVRRHMEAVTELVHHRRRVKLVWHRNHGPAFAKMCVDALREPSRSLPDGIAGVTLEEALGRFIDVLTLESQGQLKRDLEDHGPWLCTLARPGQTIAELLASLSIVRSTGRGEGTIGAALRIVNAKGVSGTVGAIVRDEDGNALILANHHVVFGGGAVKGEPICALNEDGERVHIGHGLRGQLGQVTCGGQTHFVDCAVFGLRERQLLPDWVNAALERLPRSAASAQPGLAVRKLGPGTGHTRGVIATVEHFDAPWVSGQAYEAPRQLLIDSADPDLRFCGEGDSGAAVVNEWGRIVGLLWGATGPSNGIASPIEPVLQSLAVTLIEVSDG